MKQEKPTYEELEILIEKLRGALAKALETIAEKEKK